MTPAPIRTVGDLTADAIAETQAYLEFLLEKRASNKSAISYYRGIFKGLKAVDEALQSNLEHLESLSVTDFRESAQQEKGTL